jgi:hypothetical protein
LSERSPANVYALVVGATLVVAGIVGFFYEAAFTDNKDVRDAVFGILDVNGWHNVFHISSGVLGLLSFTVGTATARSYALGLGAVYLGVAMWGFAIGDGNSILGIVPVNTEDDVLHTLIGLAGIAAGLATARR